MQYCRLISVLFVFAFIGSVHAKRIGYYFYFDNPNRHTYEDTNVKVYIQNCGIYVYNKTDKVIYVDKANCFAILNGVSEIIFKNSVETSGSNSNFGVSTYLGSISPYLNGITISGGSGTYNQVSTYEKRIIPITPNSYSCIWQWKHPFGLMAYLGKIIDNGSKSYPLKPRSRYIESITGKEIKLTKGFVRTYDLSSSPIRLKTIVKYSLKEDMSNEKEISTTENYLKALVADSYKGWNDYRVENVPFCRPFMEDTKNYQCWSRYIEGQRLEDCEKIGVWVVGLPVAVFGGMWLFLPR